MASGSHSPEAETNPVAAPAVTINNGTPLLADGRQGSEDREENKPPRLPRWTRHEIMVLIHGKRAAENRGRRNTRDDPPLSSEHQNGTGFAVLEPKWASISSYCKRNGVDRGPVQCRKRWSNLAGDFKKIKEWELQREETESFWVMRNDSRREKKLPGFFDRDVYDILDGKVLPAPEKVGRSGVEERLFFDEQSAQEESGPAEKEVMAESPETTPVAVAPEMAPVVAEPAPVVVPAVAVPAVAVPLLVADKPFQPIYPEFLDPGVANKRQPDTNPDKGSPPEPSQKRRRAPTETGEDTDLQDQLIGILEQNSRIINAHLEAQNINCELDRNQRKDHTDSLVGILSKLADALGRIADKL